MNEDLRKFIEGFGFNSHVRWFDKKGKPITVEVADSLLSDDSYKVVRQETIGDYLVSTVWVGLNMARWESMHPIIFETMIFYEEGCENPIEALVGYIERYCSEEEAKKGHMKACEVVRRVLK